MLSDDKLSGSQRQRGDWQLPGPGSRRDKESGFNRYGVSVLQDDKSSGAGGQ